MTALQACRLAHVGRWRRHRSNVIEDKESLACCAAPMLAGGSRLASGLARSSNLATG